VIENSENKYQHQLWIAELCYNLVESDFDSFYCRVNQEKKGVVGRLELIVQRFGVKLSPILPRHAFG
jgi:hypothetical protein